MKTALLLAALLVPARALAGFDGLWDTTYGRLRLVDEGGGRYSGVYAYGAGGELEGAAEGGTLKLKYRDQADGEAEFSLADDGAGFSGKWRAAGEKDWTDWTGKRVEPHARRKWLYVVENRWEERLSDREYSYGQMLKTFFDYAPDVEVRQRFFNERTALLKWLREASFLAEPVIVYVSAHGTPEGVETDSGTVGGEDLGKALSYAPSVKLLHFGSCEIMKGKAAALIQGRIPKARRFPISGFTEAVDWGGSAVADMMYLNLMLFNGLEPEKAAAALPKLLPYTTKKLPPLDPIGFAFRR